MAADLRELAIRLALRDNSRTEADLQSDVRLLLLHGDLNLEDENLEVFLEAPAGAGRRIDVEVGCAVIECKRDLRKGGKTKSDAIVQLGGYLKQRIETTGQRYVGVLTDGAEWLLYLLSSNGIPQEVSAFRLSATEPELDKLKVWLEGVLATRQHIKPTPMEIVRRLGSGTSSFAIDRTTLTQLYSDCKNHPEVQVKRMLWARLLSTAFGAGFNNDDELFIEHTYLVVVAELVAHVVVGLNIRESNADTSAENLLSGRYFSRADIGGVVEADFFDWVATAADGEQFVRDLARRIARFDWAGVEHDVLKVLYESVVAPEQRHSLGEYYTPDWLAERIVNEVITDPLGQRVLDPSCGSGTFVFAAVRRYLAAAEAAGIPNSEAVSNVVEQVYGVDVHPVAVTLARVTYLLAIGLDRLQDRGSISVPVCIGDSMQWAQSRTDLFDNEGLIVYTTDGAAFFESALRWPHSVTKDAAAFDALVSDLAGRATARQPYEKRAPITAILNRHKVATEDRAIIQDTYNELCRLHDAGRNHIWGYYIRNLARPYWLSQPENRPDVLVGNPPWLSYRFMTDEMKVRFQADCQERGLWAGAELSTSQDLSGYFVARSTQLYLKAGGKFGFVMPLAAVSRPHFNGFRRGTWPSAEESTNVQFTEPWDISSVKPLVFPMPGSVVFGSRERDAREMGDQAIRWTGSLPPGGDVTWDNASGYLQTTSEKISRPTGLAVSPYGKIFRQGATIVPRILTTVETLPAGALGLPQGRQRIRTLKSSQDKNVWRTLEAREGIVEKRFIRPLYVGSSLLPFAMLEPLQCIIPWDGARLLQVEDTGLDEYPAMAEWWRKVDAVYRKNATPKSGTLLQRLNYQSLLARQFPIPQHRVVYNRSGTRLYASRVEDQTAIIDTKLYWGTVRTVSEASYLCAIFNAPAMTEMLNPLQSRGHFGPRDFYALPFEFPIPMFDEGNELHSDLANLGARCEALVKEYGYSSLGNVQSARSTLLMLLAEEGYLEEANELIKTLLFA